MGTPAVIRSASRSLLTRIRANWLISGSAVYVAANVFSAAIPFLLLPVLTRYLSPAEYGETAMFQTLLGALSAFVGLGTAGAATRKYFDKEANEQTLAEFVGACLQILLASSVVLVGVVFVLRTFISDWLNLRVEWVLWAVVVAAMGVPVQIRLGQWEVRRKARLYGTLQNAQSVLHGALSLFLVVVALQGAAGRVNAQIVTAFIVGLAALVFLKRDGLLLLLRWKPIYLKEALSYGIPLIPHLAGAFVVAAIDRVLVSKQLGLEDAGIYMVGVQVAGALILVFDALSRAFTPWLYERLRGADKGDDALIVSRTYSLWFLMVLGGLAAVAAGGWFVELVAGARYARAGEVIGWLAMGHVFHGGYLLLSGFIIYSKRTGLLSLITIVSGMIGIPLLLVSMQTMGLQGAAIAFCSTMALRCALTWWAAQACQPMPWFGRKDEGEDHV